MQSIPLVFLLGDAFGGRDALIRNSPRDVAKRLFLEVQSRPWEELLQHASDKIWHQQAVAIKQLATVGEQLGSLNEFLDLLGMDEVAYRQADERQLVRAFIRAMDKELQENRESLQDASLDYIGEFHEDETRVHILYRLRGASVWPSIRPSVLQLILVDDEWQADWNEPAGRIRYAAIAHRQVPTITIDVLTALSHDQFQHFLCRANCQFENERVAPVFCCTWPEESPDAVKMASSDFGPLKSLLTEQLATGTARLLEMASRTSGK
ncbi:hypothetical protein NA78x_000596 [Anatilimnocola sp. NA78]|uniref:hypothetical protein n=1 Tax=Anatilimnocola sp. NA78 TaxID=3415683 RepID=UPI003CE53CBB